MMRGIVLLCGVLVFTSALAVGASRLVGRLVDAPHASLAYAYIPASSLAQDANLDGDVWCWRGLCPGRTSLTHALAALHESGGDEGQPAALDPTRPARSGASRYSVHRVTLVEANREWEARLLLSASATHPDRLDTLRLDTMFTTLRLVDLITTFGVPTLVSSTVSEGLSWRTVFCFAHGVCTEVRSRYQRLGMQARVSQVYWFGAKPLGSVVPMRGKWLTFARWR
jgi:hypothetical protein